VNTWRSIITPVMLSPRIKSWPPGDVAVFYVIDLQCYSNCSSISIYSSKYFALLTDFTDEAKWSRDKKVLELSRLLL